MAAEYSRELSVKVHAGQSRIASLGYRVGGPIGFGLRRELVDETQRSKGTLTKGERKALQTDRVRVRLGSGGEADIVRWIFQNFVVERQLDTAIARQLDHAGIRNQSGSLWTAANVHTILRNENYEGESSVKPEVANAIFHLLLFAHHGLPQGLSLPTEAVGGLGALAAAGALAFRTRGSS